MSNDNMDLNEAKRILKEQLENKNKYNNVKFENVEKQDNKFICQTSYKYLYDICSDGRLSYNFEQKDRQKFIKYQKEDMIIFESFDRTKVEKIKNEILNGNKKVFYQVILNIQDNTHTGFQYDEDDKTLNIKLDHNSNKGVFLNAINKYEEILALLFAYETDESIGSRKANVEIYNLPEEKIKEIV